MRVRDRLIQEELNAPPQCQYANTETMSLEDMGQEAIAYQGKSALFQGLTAIFEKHIQNDKSRITSDSETSIAIQKLTLKHSGLNVSVKFDDSCNAYAVPLLLNPNHPFLQRFKHIDHNELKKEIGLSKKFKDLIAKNNTEIDLKNGMIRGACSKIPFTICIGRGLWRKGGNNGEETAATYLHELGHLFTFIERVINTVTANMVMNSAIEALGRSKDRTEKIKIVEEYNSLTKSDADPEQVADAKSRKESEIILTIAYHGQFHSQTGASGHETSGSEFTADQFANRHGAGVALASGLDKVYGHDHRYSRIGFIMMQVLAAVMMILTTLILPLYLIIVTYMIFGIDYEERVYDTPADRLKRIRGDMIQSLKDVGLDKKNRAILLEDIVNMDKLIGTAQDRQTFIQIIWKYTRPKNRKAYNRRKFQQEIEELVNSHLFVRYNQIQQLA